MKTSSRRFAPLLGQYEMAAKALTHSLEGASDLEQLESDMSRAREDLGLERYALPQDLERAAEAGFDLHLAKPTDPEQISQLLGRVQHENR